MFFGSRLFFTRRWSIRLITFHPLLELRQNYINILQAINKVSRKSFLRNLPDIEDGLFLFLFLIGEEGADPRFSLTEVRHRDGNLGFIS